MLTTRDCEIIDFLTNYKIASTTTLQYFFFPSLSACQKRLLKMVKEKTIKRARDNITNEYVYYIKKPKQVLHSLKVTELYAELSGKYEIKHFKIEVKLDTIRPDAVFGYIEKGVSKIGMLEVELSNKAFDSKKYNHFSRSGEAKKYGFSSFNVFLWDKKSMVMEIIKY